MKKKIKVGGVPEHFSIHWHLLIKELIDNDEDIELDWTDYGAGTGAMMKDIDAGVLDLAITLTEGTILSIANGSKARIIDFYVKTPLVWGIHTPWNKPLELENIFESRIAISRYGSGSHLMPIVHAKTVGKDIKNEQFVIVNHLEGAVSAFMQGEADVFYWEKFTSMPFVKQGYFASCGFFPSPWPCFVITANLDFANQYPHLIQSLMLKLKNQIAKTNKTALIPLIAEKYTLEPDNVKEWIAQVEWNSQDELEYELLHHTILTLREIGLLNREIRKEELVWNG